MYTRIKEGLKVLFSLQAELGCRVLSEFQCQGRKCHNSQSCIRSRCGVYFQPHCLEGGYESRGNKSNRTYHRTLLLSACVCPLLLSQPDPRGSTSSAQCSGRHWSASEMQGKLNLGHCWGYESNPVLVIGRDRCRCFHDIFTLRSTFFLSCQVPVVPSCRPWVSLTVQPWCS